MLAGFDPHGVGVDATGQTCVQRAASPLFIEPKLAVGIVQVLRFVLQVVPHAAENDRGIAAAGPTGELHRAVRGIELVDFGRVRRTHDPAELGVDQRVLHEVPIEPLEVRGVIGGEPLLGPEGMRVVGPGEPLGLVVLGLAGPVRMAGQREAFGRAACVDHPHRARREVQGGLPHRRGLGDLGMRGALAPAGDDLRAGEDGRAHAPIRIAGQADRGAGPALFLDRELPAIDHATLEHVGFDPLGRGGAAGRGGVPGVVLPGPLRRRAVGGVGAAFVIDETHAAARHEVKRSGRPLDIALFGHAGIVLLPGERLLGGLDRDAAQRQDGQGSEQNVSAGERPAHVPQTPWTKRSPPRTRKICSNHSKISQHRPARRGQ